MLLEKCCTWTVVRTRAGGEPQKPAAGSTEERGASVLFRAHEITRLVIP
jgi:hypothetical protein